VTLVMLSRLKSLCSLQTVSSSSGDPAPRKCSLKLRTNVRISGRADQSEPRKWRKSSIWVVKSSRTCLAAFGVGVKSWGEPRLSKTPFSSTLSVMM
jgi:hypothetical protein